MGNICMERAREHVIFFDRVQGVGLRYASYYLTHPPGFTGQVESLWNGDVEMKVQRDPLATGRFLRDLGQGRLTHIGCMEAGDIPVIGESNFRGIYQYQQRSYAQNNSDGKTDI